MKKSTIWMKLLAGSAALGSVALVGCGQLNGADGGGDTSSDVDQFGSHHGESPEKKKSGFSADYASVIYLKFEDGGRFTARNAYFERTKDLEGNELASGEFLADAALLNCAIPMLRQNSKTPACNRVEAPQGVDANGNAYPAVPKPIYSNFEYFDFGSPNRMLFFIDNESVAFNAETPITFSAHGARDDNYPTAVPAAKKKAKNWSFYNANVQGFDGQNGKLLTLDNFHLADNGAPGKDKEFLEYYFTINVMMCLDGNGNCDPTDEGQIIPIAIDPGGGNGWGGRNNP